MQAHPAFTDDPARWRWRHLLAAPHRLAFFLAMTILAASGLWWAAVQLDRGGAGLQLAYAVSPSIAHATVMTFGFIPLFFAGFLFTAGPRWLGVPQPSARDVLPLLVLQGAGWLLWLAGAHTHVGIAFGGLALALAGLAGAALRFWGYIRASDVPDRLHAKSIGVALAIGCAALLGVGSAEALGEPGLARRFVLTGLWGFVVVVYAAVAHRMIPFFTSSALPFIQAWKPNWVLGLMLGVAGFEATAVWVEGLGELPAAWFIARGALEVAAGGVLMWLAFAWGLVQSLKVRLLAMLHLGFLWLGLGLVLSGLSQFIAVAGDGAALPLAPLHAVTMGCLGSLMVAMVTRVSCGHSGRALVADDLVWALFWLLQVAVVLRIAASVAGWPTQALLTTTAVLWAGIMTAWGWRYGNWYGRPRADGRPG
jgi:uncharacterized protein involved in response to NO